MAKNIFKKEFLGVSDLIEPIDEYIDPIEPIITAITKDLAVQFDGEVMRAVKELGVVVDKDRLVKALTDAFRFYDEGYIAGKNAIYKHGEWVYELGDPYCSVCGKQAGYFAGGYEMEIYEAPKYCPYCGTKMDGKDGADDGT